MLSCMGERRVSVAGLESVGESRRSNCWLESREDWAGYSVNVSIVREESVLPRYFGTAVCVIMHLS